MKKHRRLAGCVPIRRGHRGAVEVLLITSRSHPKLMVFPKGGVKRNETPESAAQRETFEEAGVKGTIGQLLTPVDDDYLDDELFSCEENDDKLTVGKRNSERAKTACRWYLLEVTEIFDVWPEREERQRSWMTVEEALGLENVKEKTRELIIKLDEYLRKPPSWCLIH